MHGQTAEIPSDVVTKFFEMTQNNVSFILQSHRLMDFCRIKFDRQGENLVVKNEILEKFMTESKVLCWLDGFMLVKEGPRPPHKKYKLCVIHSETKKKIYLPSPSMSCKSNEIFTMLYDASQMKYKIVRVWRLGGEECMGSTSTKVGFEVLTIENGFEDKVHSQWNRKMIQDGFGDWEDYLSEHVTVGSRFVYWDVRCHNFIVKLDIQSEKITKVKLPSKNVPPTPSEMSERIRFLFEHRENLVVLYAYPKKSYFFVLNQNSKWQLIKRVKHTQPWRRGCEKEPVKDIPFPTASIILRRFLLFQKAKGRDTPLNCYDLNAQLVKLMEGVEYKSEYKWVPQLWTFSGMVSRVLRQNIEGEGV